MMTWQMEQWGIIICIIWPIGFYLVLGLINYVDNRRPYNRINMVKCDFYCEGDDRYWCEVCGLTWSEEDPCPDH